MITCRCDVCGKIITDNFFFSEQFTACKNGKLIDLCSNCTKNLFKWLKNNVKENKK